MPHDEKLAAQIRAAVADLALDPVEQITEKRMFGGVCLLLNGSILIGVGSKGLLMRFAEADLGDALALPGARPMEMQGRTMKNFIFADPAAFADDTTLDAWLEKSLRYVREWRAAEAAKAIRSGGKRA